MTDKRDSPQIVVCITGPESTGKTTLAHDLSRALGAYCVEEYAREYSAARRTPAGIWDDTEYLAVARAQARRLDAARLDGHPIIVADTDAFTVWIWHRVYTVQTLPELAAFADVRADLYVLPTLEIPFTPDGIRELAWPRERLYDLFQGELVRTRRRYIEVEGPPQARVDLVLAELEQMSRLRDPSEPR